MPTRLSTGYFDRIYSESDDPWQLGDRWYEQRKYAITLALLPYRRYRHAFEPGCSVGVLTEQLTSRCDHVTSTDIASAALDAAHRRLVDAGRRRQRDAASQVGRRALAAGGIRPGRAVRALLLPPCRGVARHLGPRGAAAEAGTTVVAAHWRHPVAEYPMTGEYATDVIAATSELHHLGGYRDEDMIIEVFDTGSATSVAARTGVPGA